jgi:hypothetical protein
LINKAAPHRSFLFPRALFFFATGGYDGLATRVAQSEQWNFLSGAALLGREKG